MWFFLQLLLEHLEISLISIFIAILIALLALVMDFVLGFIEKRMNKHSVKAKKTNRIMAVIAILLCFGIAGSVFISTQQKDTIHIATKPMTEQYVLGEMLDILIEQDTDLHVELTQGVGGGTSNIQPAMESGEFDLYPEYTGTGWNMVLKHDGLVVRREIAEKYNLKTYSDLKSVAGSLTFGAEYDFFEREDGYDALCETYGLTFGKTMDLDIGLKYQAINQKKIDVMVIFTTDGQLSASDVVVLEDDKNFYPSYICGNVIRAEVLRKYPELEAVFEKMNGFITDSDMAAMNYEVETDSQADRYYRVVRYPRYFRGIKARHKSSRYE